MFLGVALGVVGVFTILFLLGDVKTEFSVKTGEELSNIDKGINVQIDKTIENGKEVTNITVVGSGSVTKEELDKELEKLFKEHGINKKDSNINIDMKINSLQFDHTRTIIFITMNVPKLRNPTVFLPLAMSLLALGMVLVHFTIFGIVKETDEGTAAHIFQLLMVGQFPIVAFLAFRWLAIAPRQTSFFIVFQVVAALAAIMAVFFLTS